MIEVFHTVDELGTNHWRTTDGIWHREDGPAYEGHGLKYWYYLGCLHRCGGPAYEGLHGAKQWFQNGLLHRTDGPAIEALFCKYSWYLQDRSVAPIEVFRRVTPVERKHMLCFYPSEFSR